MCPSVHCSTVYITAMTWKQPECLQTEGWTQKKWRIYAMECYSAIKKNETMPFAPTQTEILEIITLNEVSQTEKEKYRMTPLFVAVQSLGPNSLQPHATTRILCPYFPGKNTGVGCHFLLQGFFPTQEWDLNLLSFLHWQVGILYCSATREA